MSYFNDKAGWAHFIRCFMIKHGYKGKSGKNLNDIIVKYLKHKGLRYVKWNPRYKGINTPDLINLEYVQDNFSDFARWYIENYENKEEV